MVVFSCFFLKWSKWQSVPIDLYFSQENHPYPYPELPEKCFASMLFCVVLFGLKGLEKWRRGLEVLGMATMKT